MSNTKQIIDQATKARQFHQLHHSGKLLILPNIWDCLGALLLQDLGYPAVATASFSVAMTNGYDDGENIPFDLLLSVLNGISDCVTIPVTADIESGFAQDLSELQDNIERLLQTGVVGINFEDSDKKTDLLLPVEVQCRRIRLIKNVADKFNVPLFVNARTDVYTRGKNFTTPESRFEESIRRGLAYKDAGADCFFPLAMRDPKEIEKAVEMLQMPINIIIFPGVPQLQTLQEMGVARVSLGPSFLKNAIRSLKHLAIKLQKHDGLNDIVENEITSDYLKKLVNKK